MWRRVSLGVFNGKLFAHRSRFPSNILFPFLFGGFLLKLNSRKKGNLIFNGLLGNLATQVQYSLELQGGVARVWVGKASLRV